MNLLVTGANGVLGKSIKQYCKLNKTKFKKILYLSSKKCDLTDEKEVEKLFKKFKPSHIMHLAAKSGGLGVANSKFQATLLHDNLKMLINILESSKNYKVKKIILTLSSGMYSPNIKMPYEEKNLHDGNVEEGSYGYFFAKRLMEPFIKAYRDQYKLNVIGLVPNGIYGKEDKFDLQTSPMIPSLIKKIYQGKISNKKVEIWGNGTPLREYTYAPDLAKIYFWALKKYHKRKILNIGNTDAKSVKKIAYLICEIIGFDKKKLFFNKSKPNGVYKKNTSNYVLKNLYDFKYTNLKDGLIETIDWYKKNYLKLNKNQKRF